MSAKKPWLASYDWKFIEEINKGICISRDVEFKRFQIGGYFEQGKNTWSESHQIEMTLFEAVNLCATLHQISPFQNYNAATFATIMRSAITESDSFKSEVEREIIRSAAGHVISGTADGDEIDNLLRYSGKQ